MDRADKISILSPSGYSISALCVIIAIDIYTDFRAGFFEKFPKNCIRRNRKKISNK